MRGSYEARSKIAENPKKTSASIVDCYKEFYNIQDYEINGPGHNMSLAYCDPCKLTV